MKLLGVQPVVEVRVNGEGPFQFLVDTGAAGCGRISAEMAERLGLEEVGEVTAGDPSGRNRMTIKRVGVRSVTVGEAKFHDLSMARRDHEMPMAFGGDEGIDGILGFGLFGDCLVTLDYPGQEMTIVGGELPPADGETILAFYAPHGIPAITIRVDGVEVAADIDSGSMGPLSLPESMTDRIKFGREPIVVGKASTGFNEFEIKEAPLDGTVRVGTYAIPNPVVAIYDIFPRANLGGRFLQHFSMTFDQRHQRVRFTRDDRGPVAVRPRYRVGVMLRPGDDGLVVAGIVPGSAAERAGLTTGDRITGVNGQATDALGSNRMREVFGSPEPVKLTVDRGGESLELTVTPTRAD